MSVLALKALSVGADRIPDKFFEKVPGGYFKPPEKKNGKKSSRRQSEQPRQRRRSSRDRSPQSDYSGYSDYDTDYEQERRSRDRRRRAKSVGRTPSPRSRSRGRDRERDTGMEEERIAMDERGRGQQFPPPPVSEYRPYDPRDYAPQAAPPAAAAAANIANGYHDPYARQASATRPDYGYPPQPSSATAARYTPANGYTPSPVPGSSPLPPPNPAYAPYVPAEYAAASPVQGARGNAYPSPPPFYRQESRSQPSMAQYSYPDSQNQLTAYDPPPRQDSVSSSHRHRRGEGKHHRTRSADQHRRSHSRVTDKVRDRLENLDLQDRNLAASVGGALAGGLVGRQLGHGTLSTLIGAGIGAIGGREIEKRHEIDKAERRSRSRHGGYKMDRDYVGDGFSDDSFSDSDAASSRRRRRSSRHRYDY